ncbi:hypothetical protein GGI11_001860 [Coemansia sp. RSA 2049]|nr:hypothetical protein GGI11_001860 [Coemansia sp. RSA 2049]
MMRNSHAVNLDAVVETQCQTGDGASGIDEYAFHPSQQQQQQRQQQQHSGPTHPSPLAYASLRQTARGEAQQSSMDIDYENTVRASHYGRRLYPTFDPANIYDCPLRFIRQFEHTAQHNGLNMKMWARRFNSCLFGRAEDWAFEECPLELAGPSWDMRKRQFLDWALLPAEQELRRQRLLRFLQTEADLSIDFVYSFEEAARGLRDYKEDVWVRKCIANLLPPLRSALFELWPDGLPVRFRDLRDSLYAVDWNLYEAASTPLRVVKYGTPYAYEAYSRSPAPSSMSSPRQQTTSRNSLSSSNERPQTNRPSLTLPLTSTGGQTIYSPPAPMPTILPTRKKRSGLSTSVTFHNRNSGYGVSESLDVGPSGKVTADTSRGVSAANGGASDLLLSALSRIPERERAVIVAALERASVPEDGVMMSGDDISVPVTPTQPNGGHSGALSPMAANGAMSLSTGATSNNGIAAFSQNKQRDHHQHHRMITMSPTTKQILLKPNNGGGSSSARSRAAVAAAAAASAHITSTEGMAHRFHHGRGDISGAAEAVGAEDTEGGDRLDSFDGESAGNTDSGSSAKAARDVAVGGLANNSGAGPGSEEMHGKAVDGAGASRQTAHGEERVAAAAATAESGQQNASKIRLRTRPLTSIACSSSRPQSSPAMDMHDSIDLDEMDDEDGLEAIGLAESTTPRGPTTRTDNDSLKPRRHQPSTHMRKLSSRKSDSALTTATRSMRAAERSGLYRDSVDNALRSPEFTVVHPAIDLRPQHHTRRGRFAFIKKLSHMLAPGYQSKGERTQQSSRGE